MKKAVIAAGGKQYLVAEGDVLDVELLNLDGNTTSFSALLVLDGDKISVGTPEVSGVKVSAEIINQDSKSEKVTAIRYKAKKRVHKTRGHRQRHTTVKIKKIA